MINLQGNSTKAKISIFENAFEFLKQDCYQKYSLYNSQIILGLFSILWMVYSSVFINIVD